ncbi:hypothetical protein GCM10009677_53500 [Sphaerisporangium rubeum]|uniref:Roadblock/LAMTOR2 domain-containing protein n=1 Tax=Sphaerisporangium rubeum TaxID=321317 RepID=A0A7X0IHW1_9ACTN|nr:hypothetical protein [Sphaerisporangium rubeum]MBB6475544.1 hypothetical protein [Sphaerisporangium rubeum]
MLDIESCLTEALAVPGAIEALVAEDACGLVAASGSPASPGPRATADAFTASLRATLDALAPSAPGGYAGLEELVVTTDRGHHLLRPFSPSALVYLRLDGERANLALALHRLRAVTVRLAELAAAGLLTAPPPAPDVQPALPRRARRHARTGDPPPDGSADIGVLVRLRDALERLL